MPVAEERRPGPGAWPCADLKTLFIGYWEDPVFTLRKMGSQCKVSILSMMYLDSGYIMNVESTGV